MTHCTSVAAEIAALIRDSERAPSGLLGPVPERQIARAERELKVTFPPSFRAFLRQFGGGFLFDYEFLGLAEEPGHWLDIVQMNIAPHPNVPEPCVMFIYAGGNCAFYLDTSRRDAMGECAVVVFGPGEEGIQVADSFLDFLSKAKDGLV
jgi:antitoxin YobK